MEYEGAFEHEKPASSEDLSNLYKSFAKAAVLYGEVLHISDADEESNPAHQFKLDVPPSLYLRQFNVDQEVETIKSVQLLFQQEHLLDGLPVADNTKLRIESLITMEGLRVSKLKYYELFEDNSPSSQRSSSVMTEYSDENSGYRLNALSREELQASEDPVGLVMDNLEGQYSAISQEEANQLKWLLADIWLDRN